MPDDLNLRWDKKEQEFLEGLDRASREKESAQRNAKDYFKFLSEVGADGIAKPEDRAIDKRFIL
jgi:hypothetical protein